MATGIAQPGTAVNIPETLERLCYRYPSPLVDAVTEHEPGRRMVADTNHPDVGIQIFDPRDGVGAPTTLCHPQASNAGEHWKGPFPYARGPVKVYAPQHTHPHPNFSPDGSRVVFTSDRTGHAQVYEVML